MGICFPYLGEFQPTKHREKILCWMEMFWTLGIILLPGIFCKSATFNTFSNIEKFFFIAIAWVIIPLDFRFSSGGFLFSSWNLFVAICALPR